jgi:predicted metal-dependent hydrolase
MTVSVSRAGTAVEPAAGYRVRRSERARRARLTIDAHGEVLVVLPSRAPLSVAELLVRRHEDWIGRQRRRVLARRSRLDARPPLGEGRILSVSGVPLRVAVVDGVAARPARGRVEGHAGMLIVRLGRDGREAGTLLEAWLRAEARRALAERVAVRALEMGVRPGAIAVRDQRTRWGSASAKGSLSFSWRLVLAPVEVLDAVVVHELAHLRERGHGVRFWRLVLRHAPQTPEARRWLRDHVSDVREALT